MSRQAEEKAAREDIVGPGDIYMVAHGSYLQRGTMDLAGERRQLLPPSSCVSVKSAGLPYTCCFNCPVVGKI